MKTKNAKLALLLLLLIFYGCAITRPLPKTITEDRIIVITHYNWIGKIGKKTISEGPAMPRLRNVNNGKTYKPDYYDKKYTYFTNLEKGSYLVDEVILDGGRVIMHIKTSDKTRVFNVSESGAYYIGGVDIIDTQFKIAYNVHDSIKNEQKLDDIKNILTTKTSFSQNANVQLIKDVQIKERW